VGQRYQIGVFGRVASFNRLKGRAGNLVTQIKSYYGNWDKKMPVNGLSVHTKIFQV
jgi:hypothetical protein